MKTPHVLALAVLALTACQKKPVAPTPESPSAAPVRDPGTPVTKSELQAACAEAQPIASAPRGTDYHLPRLGPVTSTHFAFEPRQYTMADLEALAKAEQYQELLQHVEDVPPASRDAKWDALLVDTATSLLRKDAEATGYSAYESFTLAEGLLERYPKIGSDSTFMKERDAAGVRALQVCFENTYRGDECIEAGQSFAGHAKTSASARLELAKVVRRNQNAHVALPFFARALDGGDAATVCSDEDLTLALTSGLALPTDYDNAKVARSIAAKTCFDTVHSTLEATLLDAPNSYVRDNTCAVLDQAGAL